MKKLIDLLSITILLIMAGPLIIPDDYSKARAWFYTALASRRVAHDLGRLAIHAEQRYGELAQP